MTAIIALTAGLSKEVVDAIVEGGRKVFSPSCTIEIDEDGCIRIFTENPTDLLIAEWYLWGMISGFFTMKLLED